MLFHCYCSVGLNSSSVKLYDLRSFDKGPFVTFPVEKSREEVAAGSEWTGLKFSPDGRSILIHSNSPHLRLLDAYLGAMTLTSKCDYFSSDNLLISYSLSTITYMYNVHNVLMLLFSTSSCFVQVRRRAK